MSLEEQRAEQILRPIKVVFIPETGFVVAEVSKTDFGYIDQEAHYQGRVFSPKSELHITIVSRDAADRVLRQIQKQPGDDARVQEVVDSTDWSFRKLDSFHYAAEDDSETIIQMIEMPGLAGFFQDLAHITGGGYILPPTHVTLYMRGTETGIGLPTPFVFNTLVKAEIQPGEITFNHSGAAPKFP